MWNLRDLTFVRTERSTVMRQLPMARLALAIAAGALLAPASGALAAGQTPGSSTLLFDARDGRVLYAEDPDQPWYAASLTKMMTAYILFEEWASGRLKPTDKIVISPYANGQPKMRLGLGAGKEITLDDASKALIMESANDIAVAIAEGIAGTEEAFVQRMNETAKRLGMYGTRYINPNGLPGEKQFTTAKDLSRLAAALIRDFPQHLGLFAMKEAQIGKRRIATHNPVLGGRVPGGDGIKTGFTCSAGYNIVASATRNGQRLVAIILGAANKEKRAMRAAQLLDFGFARGAWKGVEPGPTIESLPETPFDREAMRTLNLDKRYVDCRDPVPELVIAALDLPTTAAAPATLTRAMVTGAATAINAPAEVKAKAQASTGKTKTAHRPAKRKKRKAQQFE
jgi:D-alanyl-D-alanine carboxypeptidase